MTQTPKSFEKDVNEFLDHFEQFEEITDDRSFTTDQIFYLFEIFMDHHKYIEVE